MKSFIHHIIVIEYTYVNSIVVINISKKIKKKTLKHVFILKIKNVCKRDKNV